MSAPRQSTSSGYTPSGPCDIHCCDHYDHNGCENNIDRKLLVICHSYNNFQKDSIEGLSRYFQEIHVLVRTNPFAEISNYLTLPRLECFKISSKIDLLNTPPSIDVMPTPLWYLPGDASYKNLGQKHFNAVERAISHHRLTFDLIHTHFTWSAGYVGARLKEKYSVPFVVTAHGYDIYSLPFIDNEWREKIEHVLNTADRIITVSQSNLACIKKLDISTPVTVIPNGFRSDLFYPQNSLACRKALNLPQDKKIILTVVNLDPIKGQMHLVEAVQKMIQERKDILCVIVGAGKLRNTLEHQIRTLGLAAHVMLTGRKSHDEIPLWMNGCDLLVLPSLRESFGVVQIEAMACGKPVVATRNGGSEEIVISDDYGLLTDVAEPDDLAETILAALEREWDREKIRTYAEQFTWEHLGREIMRTYSRLLGGEP